MLKFLVCVCANSVITSSHTILTARVIIHVHTYTQPTQPTQELVREHGDTLIELIDCVLSPEGGFYTAIDDKSNANADSSDTDAAQRAAGCDATEDAVHKVPQELRNTDAIVDRASEVGDTESSFATHTSSVAHTKRRALSEWTSLERLRAAILVDQMSRNWAALGEVPVLVRHCADKAALTLANSVFNECFDTSSTISSDGASDGVCIRSCGAVGGDAGANIVTEHRSEASGGVVAICSVPEFCFFTLVFRHANETAVIKRSIDLLEGALAGMQC